MLDVIASREATVGRLPVRRALPTRGRRTVGAWCFLDHLGPSGTGMGIGPHPHIGLQTVTWLFSGEALHRDSLGSEQLIRPGQLNLMTAGHGIAHAEEDLASRREPMHGMQLWVAQPSATRDGAPAFEHHPELPHLDVHGATAIELIGPRSPARRDTDHLGVDLRLHAADVVVELTPEFEHAIVLATGAVDVDGEIVRPGAFAYLGTGRSELRLRRSDHDTRLLLLGGTPFPDRVLMWWNYVARSREEIVAAHRDWTNASGRFGDVASPLARIDVDPPTFL